MVEFVFHQGDPLQGPLAVLEEALRLHDQGELAAAKILYQSLISVEPDHFTAIHQLGVIENQLGNFGAAEGLFQEALRLHPRSALAHSNLGFTLWNLGRPEEALSHYRLSLRLKPDSPDVLLNASVALRGLGRHREALEQVDKAMALQGPVPAVLLNRGIVLQELDRPQEALTIFDQLLALDPGNPEAGVNRGNALLSLGQPEEALGQCDRTLAAHPDSVETLLARGSCLLALKRFQEALVVSDRVLQLALDQENALVNRGRALVGLEQPGEALKSYARALPLVASPHLLNQTINDLEAELGLDELVSFPPQVFLNFNQLCNARCLFCHIPEVKSGFKDAVEPRDFERMTWLRYVSELSILGGFGESLLNPFFKENLAFLRSNHPHLRLSLWTNGISLTEELCNLLAEGLTSLVISLNAATPTTWDKVMGNTNGFERICDRLRTIGAIKASRGTAYPTISLSMVILKDNIHELPAMVDLAKEIGAEEVLVQHYSTHEPSNGRTNAPASSSMYQERERCDYYLKEATVRAQSLGIRTSFPLPFGIESDRIEAGSRVDHLPAPCLSPWKALLLFDELEPGVRQASVCCTGPFYLAVYRKEELTESGLKALWNHPNLRFLRKTINGKGRNPVCDWCQSSDRFDPADNRWDGIRKSADPILKASDLAYRSGNQISPEKVMEDVLKLEGMPSKHFKFHETHKQQILEEEL